MTAVRSLCFQYERQNGGWHTRTWCWSGFGVQRYDRLDDTALTNVDNSKRLPGESHDQQWSVLIWVTWSQGPQKWAAVTFPLGTMAVWGGTADAAVCAVQLFFNLFITKKKKKRAPSVSASAIWPVHHPHLKLTFAFHIWLSLWMALPCTTELSCSVFTIQGSTNQTCMVVYEH